MADAETKPASPVAKPEEPDGGSPKGEEPEAKVESLYAIYDVTSRGNVKTLHDAAERGKVKVIATFLNKMKSAREVRGGGMHGRRAARTAKTLAPSLVPSPAENRPRLLAHF